jgi:RNA polymerase sigma-70 factor (ECF subfamily)
MKTTLAPENSPAAADYFATTHWSVVINAGKPESAAADHALGELCRRYWYPLFAFTRHQGIAHAEAEDLVQGFFASFLKRNYLATLRKEKGRFRAFLLACLKNYLANERNRSRRKKRGGGVEHVPIDWPSVDEKYHGDLAQAAATPEKFFDRAWATTLLERVLVRLAEEKHGRGDGRSFDALKPFLMVAECDKSYRKVAASLGMSEGAVRVAVCRLRNRYQELLRAEIADTCAPALVEDEIRSLFDAFAD